MWLPPHKRQSKKSLLSSLARNEGCEVISGGVSFREMIVLDHPRNPVKNPLAASASR